MERRVVTALFVDVVGSTALIVQLGPERFKRALDLAFRGLRWSQLLAYRPAVV